MNAQQIFCYEKSGKKKCVSNSTEDELMDPIPIQINVLRMEKHPTDHFNISDLKLLRFPVFFLAFCEHWTYSLHSGNVCVMCMCESDVRTFCTFSFFNFSLLFFIVCIFKRISICNEMICKNCPPFWIQIYNEGRSFVWDDEPTESLKILWFDI